MTIGEGRDIDGQVNHDFTFMLDPLFTKPTDAASASLHPCPQSPAALTSEKHPEIPKLLHLVQQLVLDPEWTCHLFPAEDHSFRPGGDVNYHSAVSTWCNQHNLIIYKNPKMSFWGHQSVRLSWHGWRKSQIYSVAPSWLEIIFLVQVFGSFDTGNMRLLGSGSAGLGTSGYWAPGSVG